MLAFDSARRWPDLRRKNNRRLVDFVEGGPQNQLITPWSKYMAQSPKGGLIQGLYKPIHGNCAIYFYPGV